MEIIKQANPIISALLGIQKFDNTIKYRYFSAVTKLQYKGKNLYYNSATKELVALEEECGNLEYFVNNWFLVPQNFDDKKLITEIYNIFRSISVKFDDYYEVFTTTDCNARCFYCFESDMEHKNMSIETAENFADYVIQKNCGNKVKFEWFGGEPLYNEKVIDIITAKIKNAGIEYESEMITNGFLFTDKMIEKAKNLWKLNSLQITLDGTEKIYNRCKNYINAENINPFQIVTNNIETLLKSDIFVLIRLNLDFHNADNLYLLADYIKNRYGKYKNISVYAHPLYDSCGYKKKNRTREERALLIDKLIEFENYCINLKITKVDRLNSKIKAYACMPDNDNATVVSVDGEFFKCPHNLYEKPWGNISNPNIDYDIINTWRVKADENEHCSSCFNYIDCFRLKKCPHDMVCDSSYRKLILSRLKNKIKKEYDIYNKGEYL